MRGFRYGFDIAVEGSRHGNTFYWYDLETTGTNPKWDRIVQFAGLRTDAELNPVGEPLCFYMQLPDDVLPNPDASLVTGITPSKLAAEGVSEYEGLQKIMQELNTPETCALGYNNLRFDDEFLRYSLYRHLQDPYAREYRNGNTRWDMVDLVRAAGALRRDGIYWPVDEDGQAVYRLEELTKANGIDHGQAHDAMSDVYATIGMARLLKRQQPKLFDYYYPPAEEIRQGVARAAVGSSMRPCISGVWQGSLQCGSRGLADTPPHQYQRHCGRGSGRRCGVPARLERGRNSSQAICSQGRNPCASA